MSDDPGGREYIVAFGLMAFAAFCFIMAIGAHP
jgi:hypothetical protein